MTGSNVYNIMCIIQGGNAVVMSEEEYNGIMETLYLASVPGMKERMEEGLSASVEDCEDFEW